MKSGICVKCGEKNIYTDGTPKRGERSSIPVSSWKKFFVDVYVCFDCGYIEEYVKADDLKNEKLMIKAKEGWQKI